MVSIEHGTQGNWILLTAEPILFHKSDTKCDHSCSYIKKKTYLSLMYKLFYNPTNSFYWKVNYCTKILTYLLTFPLGMSRQTTHSASCNRASILAMLSSICVSNVFSFFGPTWTLQSVLFLDLFMSFDLWSIQIKLSTSLLYFCWMLNNGSEPNTFIHQRKSLETFFCYFIRTTLFWLMKHFAICYQGYK